MALLAVATAAGVSSVPAQPTPVPPPSSARRTQADFAWRVRTLDGRLVRFEAFRGRPVFLNVWATWCPPCVAEMASIQALRDSLRADSVAFVLLTPEASDPVGRFVRRHRLTAPVYLEADAIPSAFGLRGLPTTYVIDRSGAIVLVRYGAAHWDTPAMRAYLRALAHAPQASVGQPAPTPSAP